jgi:protein-L-isoaspartate(D-aspartate) O-methyltransferase
VPTQDDLAELIAHEVGDPRVTAAFHAVPRDVFVPDDLVDRAYVDVPLRIPHEQVTTQPSLTARMLSALGLSGTERVLEVGTGYGFQTALLAELAARVWSVERFADMAEAARERLKRAGIANAEIVVGDGSEGLPEQAPFDAIVVSAAFPEVPPPLVEQLARGGRLVQPIGRGGNEEVVLFRKGPQGLERRRTVTGAHFVRLVGRHGFRD